MFARARPSLEARALRWLAQREHSRSELRVKLMRLARAEALAASDAVAGDAGASAEAPDAAAVDALLDWLEAHGYLSAARFADARVHARASRHGTERIRRELAQHGVALDAEAAAALRDSEFARAAALWQRKFGVVAADAAGRARQARFLTGRGFSSEVVRRLVKTGADDADG